MGVSIKKFSNRVLNKCILFQGPSTSMRPDPFPQDPITPPDNLPSQVHRQHWRAIRTRQSRGNRVQDLYNYHLNSMDMSEFGTYVEHIFQDQTTVFKLNLSFGSVLFNNKTEQMQYHHSSANNKCVFDSPFQIYNREDLNQVRTALENKDVFEWAKQQRPNSKWVVMDITNATFYEFFFSKPKVAGSIPTVVRLIFQLAWCGIYTQSNSHILCHQATQVLVTVLVYLNTC